MIFHHAAITYGASGGWFFKAQPETDILLTFLAAINQAFFMGLFFFLSGLFVPRSLAKKGRAAFLRDRAIRLGIPVLAFGFLLGPLTVARAPSAVAEQTFAHLVSGSVVLGPLWFAAALLIFSIIAAFALKPITTKRPVPTFWRWLALALVTGLVALLVRQIIPVGREVLGFQLGYFPSYVVLFCLGLMAGQHDWLQNLSRKNLYAALAIGALALPLLPAALLSVENPRFETGLSLSAIVYAFWEPLIALGAIAGLIMWSQSYGDRAAEFWTKTAANSLGAFILHAPILVATTRTLDAHSVAGLPALILAVAVATLLSFTLAALLRRSAVVRRVI